MRVPLNLGDYRARSYIAEAQRSVNLYAEQNPQDSEVKFTHYNAPGLTALGISPNAPGRGLYWANNDTLYYVAGSTLYSVSSTWGLKIVGGLSTSSGLVSMVDNGTTLVVVDGSPNGYQVTLSTGAFAQISETANAPPASGGGVYGFYGANRIDIIDGFLVLNQPGTRNFYSTYNNEVVFDALYFAAKNGYSDNLVSLIVTRREIWLIGERTTEIWYDAGASTFPFQIMPGPFIQHGCCATYSVAQIDGAVFWLSQDQAGSNIMVRAEGYLAKRISTHALEAEWATYPTTADAQGFCFQFGGHRFYQINFPTADKTWRWDDATELWHEAVWTDSNGASHRHRASCAAWAYGINVVADWQTGQLYSIDPNVCTDAGAPMYFRRGFPHIMGDGGQLMIYPGFTLDVEAATSPDTVHQPGPFYILSAEHPDFGAPTVVTNNEPTGPQPTPILISSGDLPAPLQVEPGTLDPSTELQVDSTGDVLFAGYSTVISPSPIPVQAGPAPGSLVYSSPPPGGLKKPLPPSLQVPGFGIFSGPAPIDTSPVVNLRWSDTRGRTWSNPVPQSLGATGEYYIQPKWWRTGMGRDRVFEVFGVIPGRLAINGAFLDPPPIKMAS